MAFIPEPGKGRLFDNTIDKSKQSQPDWTGTASCPCCSNHIRLSGWRYPPSERQRVATISLQLQDYREYQEEKAKRAAAKAEKNQGTYRDDGNGDDPAPYNDDIPF